MDLKRTHDQTTEISTTQLNSVKNGNRSKKRLGSPLASLNDNLVKEDTTTYVLNTWQGDTQTVSPQNDSCNIEVINEPYKLCVAKHFLSDDNYVQDLKNELLQLDLTPKSTDLYQYHISADLSSVNSPAVVSFNKMIKGQCREWLETATGKELSRDKITITCSAYNYTDYLLCHDDQTEDRLIAYVLYLNDTEWNDSDGGLLQIFDTDENQQPKSVVKSILPEYNSFVFFEVTNKSFHKVSEILTNEATRLSINGWYHGTPNPTAALYYEPEQIRLSAVPKPKSYDMTLMNKMFLAADIQTSISSQFEEANEILLTPFLNSNHFLTITRDLKHEDICWKFLGPPNRRRYEVAEVDTLPHSIRDLVDFLQSEPMFGLLQKFTSLDLSTSLEAGTSSSHLPTCHVEVQRWSTGCYSILHDDDKTMNQKVLDAVLYFEPVDIVNGGFTSYIARDDGEELLTVTPSKNGLALTYRDEETLRFVKYVNSRMHLDVFHTISLTYQE